MAVGRRFGSSVLLLVTLASLVGLISAWLQDLKTLNQQLIEIKQNLELSNQWGVNGNFAGMGKRLYRSVSQHRTANLFRIMVEGQSCEYNLVTASMLSHVLRNEELDESVAYLAKYASRKFLARCRNFHEGKLQSAREELLGRKGMVFHISDGFIERFYNNYNNNYPRLLLYEGDPNRAGELLRAAKHNIVYSGMSVEFIAGNWWDCNAYVDQLTQTIQLIRILVEITQDFELNGYSDNFRNNVFRYAMCVDIRESERQGRLEVALQPSDEDPD